jgi:hypothetical protein
MDFNSGLPVWHASIALLDEHRSAVSTVRHSDANRRIVISAAKRLLEGVGQAPWSVERMHVAIHFRKALTAQELSELSPAWCAIPAIHEAGHGEILEASQ